MEHIVSVQSDTHGMAGPLGILLPQLAALGHEALSSLFFKSSAEGEPRIPRASYSSSILHFFHPKSQFPLPLIPPTADRKQFSSDKLLRTAKSLFCTILCPLILSSSKLFFLPPTFPPLHCFTDLILFFCPALDSLQFVPISKGSGQKVRSGTQKSSTVPHGDPSPPWSCPGKCFMLQNKRALLLQQRFVDSVCALL